MSTTRNKWPYTITHYGFRMTIDTYFVNNGLFIMFKCYITFCMSRRERPHIKNVISCSRSVGNWSHCTRSSCYGTTRWSTYNMSIIINCARNSRSWGGEISFIMSNSVCIISHMWENAFIICYSFSIWDSRRFIYMSCSFNGCIWYSGSFCYISFCI